MASDKEIEITPDSLAKQIAAADVEGFAWLLGLEFTHDDEAQQAKDLIVAALEAAKAPLSEEMAGLIESLRHDARSLADDEWPKETQKSWKAAAALERQAREIERLRYIDGGRQQALARIAVLDRIIQSHEHQIRRETARVKELEAERDQKRGKTE
jgi:hypothetical protein